MPDLEKKIYQYFGRHNLYSSIKNNKTSQRRDIDEIEVMEEMEVIDDIRLGNMKQGLGNGKYGTGGWGLGSRELGMGG